MTPVLDSPNIHPSGLGWPLDVSRETSVEPQASEPGHPSGLGWPIKERP